MKRVGMFLLMIVFAALVLGCQRSPAKDLYESYLELEQIMTHYSSEPEKLIPALDAYIETNRDLWCHTKFLEKEWSQERIDKDFSMWEHRLTAVMGRIVDLDLLIQDNLLNNPEQLNAYEERIRRIDC